MDVEADQSTLCFLELVYLDPRTRPFVSADMLSATNVGNVVCTSLNLVYTSLLTLCSPWLRHWGPTFAFPLSRPCVGACLGKRSLPWNVDSANFKGQVAICNVQVQHRPPRVEREKAGCVP